MHDAAYGIFSPIVSEQRHLDRQMNRIRDVFTGTINHHRVAMANALNTKDHRLVVDNGALWSGDWRLELTLQSTIHQVGPCHLVLRRKGSEDHTVLTSFDVSGSPVSADDLIVKALEEAFQVFVRMVLAN